MARARNPLDFATGDPLVVLLGPGTTDVTVGADYQERSLDESLWHALRAAGYQWTVFSSPSNPVYSLDSESLGLIKAVRAAGEPRAGQNGPAASEPSRLTSSWAPPSRGLRRLGEPDGRSTATPASNVSPGQAGTPTELDLAAVTMLTACMRQRGLPTAVVISRAEHFLQFVSTQRGFAEWPDAGIAPDNLCVLAFTSRSLESVTELARSVGLSTLVAYLERQSSRHTARAVSEIGEADRAEMERIIQVARLRYGLHITDWQNLDRMVTALAAQQGVPTATWLRRLRTLARSGSGLSEQVLREHGWVQTLPSGQSAWDRLCGLTGLTEVKEHIDRLRWRAEAEVKRRQSGRLREADSLHLVFTGNPGTGKTTVAGLVGELYRDMGLLRRGHVHAPEAADLIGMYVGHTAVQTNRAVDAALDGVLFIDEAYRLSEQPGGFGQEAIDALVTRMDNDRERLVVVVAGYPDKMETFLRSNPGLPRRFPRGNVLAFPDYTPDELLSILFGLLTDRDLSWVPELHAVLGKLVQELHTARDETFGNAGDMRNLAQELETNWAQRVRADITEPLTPDDVPSSYRSRT